MNVGLSFSIFGKRTCVMGGRAIVPDERHFAQCAENGIDRVELIIMDGYIPPGDMKLAGRIRRVADDHGVAVNSVHGPSGWPTNGHWLGDPDESARRRNVQERCLAIEGAALLGARYMVVELEAYSQWPYWPHGQPAQHTFPEAWDQWRRSFDELLPVAEQAGVTLAIENVDGVPDEHLPGLFSGLTRNQAGVCFDSSHATYGRDFWEHFDRLAPYIIGTHLSDNDGLSGGAWVDRHWRPFEGVIEWPRLVATIAARSPCECLILEVLDREKPRITPELVGALRRIGSLLPPDQETGQRR
jgi:sugar phosphate isomerase/epimerase